ncbi:glycoside hydrolase family 43 protein [Raoultella planticola]|uniref:family 43 glycosylhydrolase n=1 Tax=Raoultella planticola TaxID=575 RepID=UPI00177DEF6C|nr:family 43 glycosylhydrolase [Raoultella planticola]MBE0091699.1 glycoside hydrolase family 43 protein [Raoultella planticola]
MIKNPVLGGFNPDPAICRRGADYYIAVSSFEWFPGIPVYHSTDLENWTLRTHVLNDPQTLDLRKLRSAKGIWAPCLTWCEADQLFYVVYGIMNAMNGRYFDVDNYLVTAAEISGPWSEPVYIHSVGYDASVFHDDDGRKWIVAVDWETRDDYSGAISIVEYDPLAKAPVGYPQRIWQGVYGMAEGAHITRRNGYYYIMCAEGGTGYGHCVTLGRARHILGPYEKDPQSPLLTSARAEDLQKPVHIEKTSASAFDKDYLRRECFNPASALQKSGHASYVEDDHGNVIVAHLCARPLLPELACTLGRETALQKMRWTPEGWLRLSAGGNLAQEYVEIGPSTAVDEQAERVERVDFSAQGLSPEWYAPRIPAADFTRYAPEEGYLSLRGQESLCSENRVSLLARKLTSVYATLTACMDFQPEVFQHSAGLVLYYDNMNYLFLQKTFDDRQRCSRFYIIHVDNGLKREDHLATVSSVDGPVYLRLAIDGKSTRFFWSPDNQTFHAIGQTYSTALFSDEYSRYGEFTGAFVGIGCVDSAYHRRQASFYSLEYRAFEQRSLPQPE